MDASSDRRKYQRYSHKSPIDLYRTYYKDNRHYAEMIDCCHSGLSLTTNEKLVLGELVYVELKDDDTNIKLPIEKMSYSGIVRWGKRYPLAKAETNNRYKYGIEFSNSASAL